MSDDALKCLMQQQQMAIRHRMPSTEPPTPLKRSRLPPRSAPLSVSGGLAGVAGAACSTEELELDIVSDGRGTEEVDALPSGDEEGDKEGDREGDEDMEDEDREDEERVEERDEKEVEDAETEDSEVASLPNGLLLPFGVGEVEEDGDEE